MKFLIVAISVCSCILAQAQSSISSSSKYAWTPNTGWINFRHDTPSSPAGISVGDFFLTGYAYGANIGWIHFGDGSPDNGHSYSGTSTDYGVNHDSRGNLTGYAYSANTGWVNFDWTDSSNLQRPRVNLITGAFSGYAYSGNLGWINLGTGNLTAETILRNDSDLDLIDDAWEMLYFGNLTSADGTSNSDGDPVTDRDEYGAGSNPTTSSDMLTILSQRFSSNNTSVTLEFTSNSNRAYRIEFTEDMSLPMSWTDSPLGTFFAGQNTTTTKSFTFASEPSKHYFFRVVATLPLP